MIKVKKEHVLLAGAVLAGVVAGGLYLTQSADTGELVQLEKAEVVATEGIPIELEITFKDGKPTIKEVPNEETSDLSSDVNGNSGGATN